MAPRTGRSTGPSTNGNCSENTEMRDRPFCRRACWLRLKVGGEVLDEEAHGGAENRIVYGRIYGGRGERRFSPRRPLWPSRWRVPTSRRDCGLRFDLGATGLPGATRGRSCHRGEKPSRGERRDLYKGARLADPNSRKGHGERSSPDASAPDVLAVAELLGASLRRRPGRQRMFKTVPDSALPVVAFESP